MNYLVYLFIFFVYLVPPQQETPKKICRGWSCRSNGGDVVVHEEVLSAIGHLLYIL